MTQYIKNYNIANNSLISVVFNSDIANNINAASISSDAANTANVSAQAVNTSVTLQTQQIANTAPTINVISITDSSYNVLDDTAANTTGAYLQITGSNFQSGAIVMVGSSNTALTTTLVNSNTLRAQIPAITSGTYPVYVVNTNGGTGIRVNGLTTSSFPAWSTGSTLSNQIANTAFSVSLSASSDSGITYSNTSVLPTGTSLLANGYFSGTVTIGVQTTYSFNVKATDAENQDATRTFSVTVTVGITPGLYMWGRNDRGQLGQNDVVYRSSPVQVGSGTTWSQISTSSLSAAAIKTDGTLWTWGRGIEGQLGRNDQVDRSSPTQIGVLTNWSSASAGTFNIIAIKTNGTLWVLGGANFRGQQGLNDQGNYRSSPTQIGALTNWSQVAINPDNGNCMVIARKTDGTLWTWGYNGTGNLGQNNLTYRSSPVQVGTGTTWSQVSVGRFNAAATKTDGTLWIWSNNSNGQLGQNDRIDRSSPVQIGSGTTWSQVSVGMYSIMATKTDGTLWTWGFNNLGQLGLNDLVNRSSPVQIGVLTNWSLVSSSRYITTAKKTDGTLWTWGFNNLGQQGLNDRGNYRSSPTQIGSATNWSQVSAGESVMIAIAT